MSKQSTVVGSGRGKPRFQRTCAACGGRFASNHAKDGPPVECRDCFRKKLSQVEDEVLSDYGTFGAVARGAAAQILNESFAGETDEFRRQVIALQVFELAVLQTEALAMLYFALRDRHTVGQPILWSLETLDIDDELSDQWLSEVSRPTDVVLEHLGFINESIRPRVLLTNRTEAETLEVLRATVEGMQNAALHRNVDDGRPVRAANKLRHGFLALRASAWPEMPLPAEPQPSGGRATILQTERDAWRFVRIHLTVTDDQVSQHAALVVRYSRVAAILITARVALSARERADALATQT